jgi:GTP-binding protein
VTRDRVEYLVHEQDRYFELIDTGGLGIEDVDNLTDQIEYQIRVAIEQADLLLFVVDAKTGLVPLDLEVGERLRRVDKPKLLVVNKCDSSRSDAEVHEFRRLCEAPLIVVSVKANRNRDELVTAIVEHLPPESEIEAAEGTVLTAEPELKLAIVGRRNVGRARSSTRWPRASASS